VPSLAELTGKFRAVWPLLNERTRRLMAASEAKALGHCRPPCDGGTAYSGEDEQRFR